MTGLTRRLLFIDLWRRIADAARRLVPTRQDLQTLGSCLMRPRSLPTCLRCWWRNLSLDRRHFLVNLMVGLAIVWLLHLLHNAPVLGEAEDVAMDWVMQMREGSVPDEPTLPLGWIDIDDETYLNWEEPLYVPRMELAQLIRFALQTQLTMLVIDIDLAQRGHARTFDQPVINVLTEHADKCRDKPLLSEDCPPVILLASLRTSESGLPVQRTSYLDELVSNSRHLFWASPLFDKDWDQIIRRWRIWEAVWRETDNQPAALPSIQLLAATLLTNREGALEMEKLQSCLDLVVVEGYQTMAERAVSSDKPLPCIDAFAQWDREELRRKKEKLTLSWDRVARRILYTIPWQADAPGTSGGTIPTVKTTDGKEERLLLSRISALSVGAKQGQPRSGDLQGRVVFIGGSFRDGRDIHASPLGAMPGVLVLMNALHSLLQYGELQEVCLPIKLLTGVLLIALLSIAFSVWDSFWGMIIASFTIIAAWVPISVCLFGYGFWLDFALPLVAIQIYQIAAGFEEGRAARRTTISTESPFEDGDQEG